MDVTATAVYDLPQEHKDFRATIRQIARERIAPRAAEIDATGEYPWDIRRLLAEQDILGAADRRRVRRDGYRHADARRSRSRRSRGPAPRAP